MTNEAEVTDLEVHTLDSLCEELVSGRGVRFGENGDVIQFNSETTRSIFNWYLSNRQKWSGLNRKEDVASIVQQLEGEPPNYPQPESLSKNLKKEQWHLKKIRANEFGGIHRNEKLSEKPAVFEYDCEKKLAVFEGNNGAGKSSLLSAICWCLTGQIYRSQKQPEDGALAFDVWLSDDLIENTETNKYQIAKITPIPSAEVLQSNKEKQLPINTWVELILENESLTKEVTLRRSLQRKKNGKKIIEEKPDFSKLDLIPIAREIGTRITGQIPYLQLEHKNDLSNAIAQLTGFSELKYLVTHARKSKDKLDKALPGDRDQEIESIDLDYESEAKNLSRHFQINQDRFDKYKIPHSSEIECEAELNKLIQEFKSLQIKALEKAEEILGEEFNPEDANQRIDLIENISPAISLLSFADDSTQLKSLDRLFKLQNISDETLKEIVAYLNKLAEQLEEISKYSESKELTARIRLYAKISSWIKEKGGKYHLSEECPVCNTNMKDLEDPVIGGLVLDQIQFFLKNEAQHLEHSLEQWSESSAKSLVSMLGEISIEAQSELPESPGELVKKALVEELFRLRIFSGSLSPLSSAAKSLCENHISELDSFDEPVIPKLFSMHFSGDNILLQTVRRVYRILEYNKWLRNHRAEIEFALRAIVGHRESLVAQVDDFVVTESSTILQRLMMIKNLITSQEPLEYAINQTQRLLELKKKRRRLEAIKELYKKTSVEIEKLFSLEQLVNQQVASVMQPLSENTILLKKKMYKPSYLNAPQVEATKVQEDSSLVIEAKFSGTSAEAHHFCNASDLRATLISLMFSFWMHLKESHSSLSIFLLDDIQELFDSTNKWRLADAISKMVKDDARIILTTNDPEFAKNICKAAGDIGIDHRQILPATGNHQVLILNESITQIIKRRNHFENHENDHQAAQEYLNSLRIYLESCLSYFFDYPVSDLPEKPTFANYYTAIVERVKEGVLSFSGQVFKELIQEPSLQPGSDIYRLLNESHHHNADRITYNEVYELKNELKKITKLVELAREEYERWIRREPPLENKNETVVELEKYNLSLDVPLAASLAASSGERSTESADESEEIYSPAWLNQHTIFLNKTDNMGFAAQPNTRLLVETRNSIPEDQSWVIAKQKEKFLVRRVVTTPNHYEMVTLIGESSDPTRRCPPLHVRKDDVLLYRVVGVLFDESQDFRKTNSDAIPDENCKILAKVKKAFRVEGTSALPLAIDGQILLGGRELLPSDFTNMEGCIVGLGTKDGNLLKRLGKQINLPNGEHIRQFDSIGGVGESYILRTEEIEDDPYYDVPLIESAVEILGVIYEN